MKSDRRSEREQQIEQAAYEVLEDKGFAGASMLAIARRAKASNETLYRWYGDKLGLFGALVERNAADLKGLIETRLDQGADPLETLDQLGPILLGVLTGPRAIALNRAAAADASGQLGAAITSAGRAAIAPLIGTTMERARAQGALRFDDTPEAVGLYLDLLVGDLQIRRAIGQLPALSDADMKKRASLALARFQKVLGG